MDFQPHLEWIPEPLPGLAAGGLCGPRSHSPAPSLGCSCRGLLLAASASCTCHYSRLYVGWSPWLECPFPKYSFTRFFQVSAQIAPTSLTQPLPSLSLTLFSVCSPWFIFCLSTSNTWITINTHLFLYLFVWVFQLKCKFRECRM